MPDNERMIADLAKLISIKSVTRTDCTKEAVLGKNSLDALNYMLELCSSFGFRTKNCDNLTGWAEIGEGSEMVAILVHLDVVPEGDGWTRPCFELTRENGRVYGRGVSDDKGPAMTCVYAMKDILEAKTPLKRRIRMIFGMSEETGAWDDMEHYVRNEELPVFGITPDADFPAIYGEKGIMNIDVSIPLEKSGLTYANGGTASNVVPALCEAAFINAEGKEIRIETAGQAAHGSMPQNGVNAISKAMEKIACEGGSGPFIEFYNKHIGFDVNGGKMGCGFEDEKSGKLTMNAGVLKAEDGVLTLTIDLRVPVTYGMEDVKEQIDAAAEAYGMTTGNIVWKAPIYMDKDGEVISTLVNAYRRITGDNENQPMVIGGGTYARAMKNIVAFGPGMPGRETTEHMADENVLEEDLFLARKIYSEALAELAML